MHNWTNTV